MDKLLAMVLLIAFTVAALIISPLNAVALDTPIVVDYSRDYLETLVERKAKEYGVSKHLAFYVVENESSWKEDAVGDMNITCPTTGEPVRARGMWQITECYHPEVSDEQAFDPRWSTDWSLKMIGDGECSQWTTCRNYYGM